MGHNYPRAACFVLLCLWIAAGCQREKYAAQEPLYLHIPDIALTDNPDRVDEGSLHEAISTVFILVNGRTLGTFELPLTIPLVLQEGTNDVEMFPGIKLNGISSSRVIYEAYESIRREVVYSPATTAQADTVSFDDLRTSYDDITTIRMVEDFDQAGLNLEPTPQSDTGIVRVSDSSLVFHDAEHPSQNNGSAGVIVVNSKNNLAKIVSSQGFELPTDGSNVYLELTYRCSQPFYVGVLAEIPGQPTEQPTVLVNPQEEWNKIYINLVTELTALSGADRFKILFSVFHDDSQAEGAVYLDNIKLVY